MNIDDLLSQFRKPPKHEKNSDPDAQARKRAARSAGLHVDPRPATEQWNDNIQWTPIALTIRTHVQRCRCCAGEAETLVGYFLKSTALHQRTRWERVDAPHYGLPEELETTEEDLHECPQCIRLDRVLREFEHYHQQLPLELK